MSDSPDQLQPAVAHLLALVKHFHIKVGYERSFRLSPSTILPNRFVLWISKQAFPIDPDHHLAAFAQAFGLPPDLLPLFLRHLPDGHGILVGLEQSATGTVSRKVYVDLKLPEKISNYHDDKPVLAFKAFKWDHTSSLTTDYLAYPSLTIPAIEQKIAAIYAPRDCPTCRSLATAFLQKLSSRGMTRDFRYMEVTEDNGRRSFVLHLYPAKLTLADLAPELALMQSHFAIPPAHWSAVLPPILSETPGWLAAGLHRNGDHFMSLYYAWQWLQG